MFGTVPRPPRPLLLSCTVGYVDIAPPVTYPIEVESSLFEPLPIESC